MRRVGMGLSIGEGTSQIVAKLSDEQPTVCRTDHDATLWAEEIRLA